MSGKIKLGKTGDSRTRRKPKAAISAQEAEALQRELSAQPDFTNYLLRKGYSASTTGRYVHDVERFIRWAAKQNTPINHMRYADILGYMQAIRKSVKQRTVSSKINSLKHYFHYLATSGQIAENPVTQVHIRGIKRKTFYDLLNRQELESLYHHFEIPDEDLNPQRNQSWFKTSVLASKRNKVILGLMIWQGVGTQELSRLTESDLKLKVGEIYIAGGRRSNERTLKLQAHQVLDLMEYSLKIRAQLIELTGKTSDRFFISTGTSSRFSNIMAKLMEKLNKQHSKVTSAKQIRTSVIVHWLKIHNLREVQYMAGHRYVSSTEAYQFNDLDNLQDDITKFHPIS